jgi:MFS family permease
MASSGIGAFVGSLWLLSIPRHHRTTYLRVAITAIVLSMTGLSLAQGLGTAAIAMITLTLGTSTMFGIANTIVQERAPDWIRGRVSALAGLSFFGVLPFAGLLITKFADIVGIRAAFGGCAAAYAVFATLLLYGHRHLSTEPRVAVEAVT